MTPIELHILDQAEAMFPVEALQREVWPGCETDILPAHILLAAVHNGGLVIGAFMADQLIGFVFGFPGFYSTADGPRLKHCSHMLAVHPEQRDQGVGFLLKRAQWQMVRKQGLDRITWTYDPLLSRNAYLNIARLGAVCNVYRRDFYGPMRDALNLGLPSDRFEVDWWVNTRRVDQRLSKRPRRPLVLADFTLAEAPILSPLSQDTALPERENMLLVEIPPDFQSLRTADPDLALRWRLTTRASFENLFELGYLITDFVYTLPEEGEARSFYVLTHSESTF